MKVVHLCVTASGGAGLCCRRISKILVEQGIESHVLTMLNCSNDPQVERVHWGLKWFIYRAVNKLLYKLHLPITDNVKVRLLSDRIGEPLSMPVSVFDVENHPLVKNADIIHLHSVAGFVDYPSFFKNVNKPVVWTLHDENFFHGLCHFSRNNENVGKLENKYYQVKVDALRKKTNLGIVFLSEMMCEKYKTHELIAGRPCVIINNPVDTSIFIPVDKNIAREKLEIKEDALVFIFVAARIDDRRKNLCSLCAAIEYLKLSNVVVLAVGRNVSKMQLPNYVKSVGAITDFSELATAYSSADYFISTSYQEAFAQTPLEAMSCGIPVILTPVSGTSELIKDCNGIRCDGFKTEDIAKGIKRAINIKYDGKVIREDMIKRYSPSIIAKQYTSFYNQMLNL